MNSPRPALAALLLLLLGVSQVAAQAKLTVSKLPIPVEADRTQALALIQDVYKQEYEAAKTDIQKVELAKKLLADAQATRNNPTNRYVLLRVAKDIAGGVGHLATAYEAIDLLDAEFAVDPLQLKADALTSAAKAAKLPSHYQALAPEFVAVITQSMAADRYDIPAGLKDTATDAARKTRDGTLTKTVLDALARSEEQQQAFAAIQPALATLEQQPADPAANLAVGKFQCMVKGNWTAGVPMLALGSDDALKAIAIKELADRPEPLPLADAWWDYAATLTDPQAAAIRGHAADWYQMALPSLDGFAQKRVDQRLAEYWSTAPQQVGPFPPALVILTFDRKTIGQIGGKPISADLSGRNNHGYINNPQLTDQGRFGDALFFDGKDDGVDLPQLRDLLIQDVKSLSLCCWLKSNVERSQAIFCIGHFAERSVTMSYNSTSFRYLVVERAAEGPSGPINQWHHLAGVWDGEQISLYVNGQLTQSQPARGFVLNSKNLDDHRGRIGRHAKPDRSIARYFSGTLDDFAIFAGALTPEQVQAVYRQGLVEAMK